MRPMSFWTSFSSKRRPIRRLTANIVFLALVTAWRLAEAPTRISPSSRYATTEGVVRAPSEFSITFGWPPSMIATQLFVVPRSMPMILLIALLPPGTCWMDLPGLPDGVFGRPNKLVSCAVPGLGDRDHRRAQDAIVEQVALLEHLDDAVGGLVALDHRHRLVLVRIELAARSGVDRDD